VELRQLRYFVRVVDMGSMGRAAVDLDIVTSTLSQQISSLEGELSTRLLQRLSTGVVPTDAGLDFYRQAQLILRQVEAAARIAQMGRLSGDVRVGLSPTTSSVIAIPLMRAMGQRYPDVRLRIVEGLSGHIAALLNSRQVDLAIVFDVETARRWSFQPLLEEDLFLIGAAGLAGMPAKDSVRLSELGKLPLILPSEGAGSLRTLVSGALRQASVEPNIVAEIDGLATLLDAVRAGMGATIHPASALGRLHGDPLRAVRITDRHPRRRNLLASLSDDELSPAGLATRVVLGDTIRQLVNEGTWRGATLLQVPGSRPAS
jgi:LysR family tcuABC transcriptional regulator